MLHFTLSAECGPSCEAAETFANHFRNVSWVLSNGADFSCRVGVVEALDWWCIVSPTGVSQTGIHTPEDAYQMTEIGLLLYQKLRSAPPFRYALVGIEVDQVRHYNELVTACGKPDVPFHGFVIAEMVWHDIGCPVGFTSFAPGYLWTPYQGEVYSPLEVSPQLTKLFYELLDLPPTNPTGEDRD